MKLQDSLPDGVQVGRRFYRLDFDFRNVLKMMEIQFRLAKKYDDPETRRDLSVCYCKLGALYEARKDYNRAFFFYHSDLEISQALAGDVATPDAFDDAAVSCENLIRVCLSSDRVEEAKKYMAMKLEYKERYAYSVQNLMGYHALAKSHLEFSRYCHGEERNDHLDQAADIWDQLAELFPHDPSLSKWAAYARKLMENT